MYVCMCVLRGRERARERACAHRSSGGAGWRGAGGVGEAEGDKQAPQSYELLIEQLYPVNILCACCVKDASEHTRETLQPVIK